LNKTIEDYNGIMDPIGVSAEICLKASKLTDTDATLKHVILGLFVSAAADKSCNYEEMKKEITFLEVEPFIKFGPMFTKYDGLAEGLPAWITALKLAVVWLAEVCKGLATMPIHLKVAAESAPGEFASIEGMEKLKALA
jgi:hypothetical protein